jgi:anti-sigma-K factor RskA
MFYTNVIIQDSDSESLNEKLLATLDKRWEFVSVTKTGGTQRHRLAANAEWIEHLRYTPETYNSEAQKQQFHKDINKNITRNATYYETVRFWESAAIAQDFVAAVQALNLAGVTASYQGDTDPTAV